MSKYIEERRVFDLLKARCSDEARKSYESAIKNLLENYNTTIYENRFLVGGVVEIFTYALLYSVGVRCQLHGGQGRSGDLLLPQGQMLSIKGVFTGGVGTVKLINQLGEGERYWEVATFFVVSGIGIIFGAPDMVEGEHVHKVGDGVQLSRIGLRILADNPHNVISMNIVKKPATALAEESKKASDSVARSILRELDLRILLEAFEQ